MLSDSRRSRVLSHCRAGILLLAAMGLLWGCGDEAGVWPRYRLERAIYAARQQLALADLQSESGQIVNRAYLRDTYSEVVDIFSGMVSDPSVSDSALFAIGGEALLQLADLYLDDSLFEDAGKQFELVANDSRFLTQYHRIALMGLGRILERKGDYLPAAARYGSLLTAFYPPFSAEGVNRDVLQLPNRMLAMARTRIPDSLSLWEDRAKQYYNGLASDFPGTEVGMSAIGELAKIYTQRGEWEAAIETLERAVDSGGAIIPPYWIDIGEISASQLKDTTRAIAVFARVSEAYPDSPFRVDADLKRAQLLKARRKYETVREVLSALKSNFSNRPAAILPAQLLYAVAFEEEGNWERAKNEYLYLITTFPESIQAIEAALAVAHHFVETGETGRVEEWYKRADELATELTNVRRFSPSMIGTAMDSRVEIAVEQKHWNDAAERLRDIIKTFSAYTPAGAVALVRLGWLELRELRDTTAAAQAWQRFLEVYPAHPESDTLRTEMNKWPNTYKQDVPS